MTSLKRVGAVASRLHEKITDAELLERARMRAEEDDMVQTQEVDVMEIERIKEGEL